MFVKENIKSFKNIFLVEMKILKLLNYLMDVWIILALIESSCVSFFLVKLKLRVFYNFFLMKQVYSKYPRIYKILLYIKEFEE
jgi:hypothetical protein